ncbi:MAG: type VII toxin-antitoxin system HepT family RNase toxin [Desulfocucumaceae bacterium]
MKFNADVVQKLLAEYLEACRRLKELSLLPLADFAGDPHKTASAKYHFIIAIESATDLCNHIIARNGLRVPEDYADTFRVMAENKCISTDFSGTLIKMAKFRNRLVHRYWNVDTEFLHNILTTNLGDLDRFLDEIRTRLNGKN